MEPFKAFTALDAVPFTVCLTGAEKTYNFLFPVCVGGDLLFVNWLLQGEEQGVCRIYNFANQSNDQVKQRYL